MSVQRWDLTDRYGEDATPKRSEHGYWVTHTAHASTVAALEAEIAKWKEALRSFPIWKQRGADRLADEVAVLVERRIIDARSPAGDALLDYRHDGLGPGSIRTERIDRLVEQEATIARLREALHTIDCPCCGGVAAIARFFEDGQETICGCGGVVECDGETAHVWVEVCESQTCADRDAALTPATSGEKDGG